MINMLQLMTRQVFIFLFFVFLLVVNLLPIWSSLGVLPNFLSAIIYLWAVYRPDLTYRHLYVALGIVRDSVFGYPLGVSVFEILLIVGIADFLRKYVLGRSYWIVWAGYGVFSFISSFVLWGLLSWVKGVILPVDVALKTTCVNLLMYPILGQVSLFAQKQFDSLKEG